jgi:hypothetical protein
VPEPSSRESFFTSSPARPKIAWRSFFRRELVLRLRRDLADEDVAGADAGTDANHAVFAEVLENPLGDVRDVAGELFLADLRFLDGRFVVLDVDRREDVVADQLFGHEHRVFEVVAVPRHEGDEDVLAERQFPLMGGRAVRDDLTAGDLVAFLHDRTLVLAGAARSVR